MRYCFRCKKQKDNSIKFGYDKNGIQRYVCQKCVSIYRQKQKEKHNRKWIKEDNEKKRQWKIRHPELQRRYRNKWSRKKSKEAKYRIDNSLKSLIWLALKGEKAGRKWEKLVGYTLEDLMKHLKKQFDDKMTWGNYGSYWSIDHRKPRSLFHYKTAEDPEFKKCWALENLQPMEKIANIKKGKKLIV